MIVKRVLDAILVFILIICLNLYLCDFSPWMVSVVLWGAVWCHVVEGCNGSDLDWNGRQKVFCFIYISVWWLFYVLVARLGNGNLKKGNVFIVARLGGRGPKFWGYLGNMGNTKNSCRTILSAATRIMYGVFWIICLSWSIWMENKFNSWTRMDFFKLWEEQFENSRGHW